MTIQDAFTVVAKCVRESHPDFTDEDAINHVRQQMRVVDLDEDPDHRDTYDAYKKVIEHPYVLNDQLLWRSSFDTSEDVVRYVGNYNDPNFTDSHKVRSETSGKTFLALESELTLLV